MFYLTLIPPLFAAVLLIVSIFKTFSNKAAFYILIILPAILISPLIFIPHDLITIFIWLLADFSVLISVISIAVVVFKILKAKIQNKPSALQMQKVLQPVLVIVVYMFANWIVGKSMNFADVSAKGIAAKLENDCKTSTVCPQRIEGWTQDGVASIKFYGYTAKYSVRYEPAQDLQSFRLYVHHNVDGGLNIEGGVNQEIEFR